MGKKKDARRAAKALANRKPGRPAGEKSRCSGAWTEAKFNSFIKNQLRGASRKWAPIGQVMREANRGRGLYLCAECGFIVPVSIKHGRKRTKNVLVDHEPPIVDPNVGFTTWDDCINRMFCEKDGLQVLCKDCHDKKSKIERDIATARRRKEKLNGS